MKRIAAMVLASLMVGTALVGMALALDPLDPNDAKGDSDGDGLINLVEFIHGTDPTNADTDAGGADDGWEVYFDENRAAWAAGHWLHDQYARFDVDGDGITDVNVDPNERYDPTDGLDELDFTDTDGWSNIREYQEGTDPTNPDTDSDSRMDDVDPQPLIPDPAAGPGKDGNGVEPTPVK
jgi:hypothetical protein